MTKKTVVENENTVCVALNRPLGIVFKVNGKEIEINGNAVSLKGKDLGVLPVGAYGLTTIDKKDWEAIQKEYGKMKIFQAGLIFATGKSYDSQVEAENREDLRNGLEPVDTKKTRTKEYKGN